MLRETDRLEPCELRLVSWGALHSIAMGGVAAHVSELAAAMAQKGHEVHVFTRGNVDQKRHDRIDGVHYHRCLCRPDDDFVDDVNNLCRPIVDRVFEVEDLVGHFDVIHAHDWLAANAMIWIKQGRGHTCLLVSRCQVSSTIVRILTAQPQPTRCQLAVWLKKGPSHGEIAP